MNNHCPSFILVMNFKGLKNQGGSIFGFISLHIHHFMEVYLSFFSLFNLMKKKKWYANSYRIKKKKVEIVSHFKNQLNTIT